MKSKPLIIDIKRDSHVDGPGIRSVVFFKGCPLSCVFCHNPESQEPWVEIAFAAKDCTLCGKCEEVCKSRAIDLCFEGRIVRGCCTRCGKCVRACAQGALKQIGKIYTAEALTTILFKDEAFYKNSGGGVTISGGECTLYPDYLEELLQGLKKKNIHIALETSGYFDYELFRRKILPHLDIIYYDIKIEDAELHKKYLGRSNELIIANLRRLVADIDEACKIGERNVELKARVPLIPMVTDSRENLSAIVDLLIDVGVESVALLPYNPMGMDMARKLGKEEPALPKNFMTHEAEKKVFLLFESILKERGGSGATLAEDVGEAVFSS
jgi:pyruvate formate lyase activating enzyme